MNLTPVLLIFAAGAVTVMSAGSIGNATVQTSGIIPVEDACQRSASGPTISIGCQSFSGQTPCGKRKRNGCGEFR